MEPWMLIALGAVAGTLTNELIRKMWRDLIPDRPIFTWKRIGFAVLAAAVITPTWVLVRVATGDEPLSATLAGMFLAIMLTIAMLATWYGALVNGLYRRVSLIEKHCGLSSRG